MVLTFIISIILVYVFSKKYVMISGTSEIVTIVWSIASGCAFGLFGASMIGLFCPYENQWTENELVAMEDNFGVEESFFLGIDRVYNEEYYFFHQKRDDGGFDSNKIRAKSATVYEESGRNDAVIKKCSRKITGYGKYFGTISANPECVPDERDKIYVPEGTIKRVANLDLQ